MRIRRYDYMYEKQTDYRLKRLFKRKSSIYYKINKNKKNWYEKSYEIMGRNMSSFITKFDTYLKNM